MDIFSIGLTHNEIVFIRQTLELPSISGRDAKFLASLQIKIETELAEIQRMLTLQEAEKQTALQEIVEREEKKAKREREKEREKQFKKQERERNKKNKKNVI